MPRHKWLGYTALYRHMAGLRFLESCSCFAEKSIGWGRQRVMGSSRIQEQSQNFTPWGQVTIQPIILLGTYGQIQRNSEFGAAKSPVRTYKQYLDSSQLDSQDTDILWNEGSFWWWVTPSLALSCLLLQPFKFPKWYLWQYVPCSNVYCTPMPKNPQSLDLSSPGHLPSLKIEV